MLTGFAIGGLELRRKSDGSAHLAGRFPYNSRAVLSDGGRTGRPRKEQFASGAFRYSVDSDAEIHLLSGHSFDKPLASRGASSLKLIDADDALTFSAEISPELADVSYVRDALAGLAAGLIVGISPGFRIPPQRTVPDAESVEEEDPSEGTALIRTIHQAILFELSLVTRPAYSETEIEARSWSPTTTFAHAGARSHHNRWRA
ncbi:HK97 family phage prohead protease [Parasedimentitalea psychrophila]|uniref:HK97 family phage prohead protease n=1 Tax=Parasedimentitalea psychrophila TaxID=2997337 RepID=A0A9Y2P619_9RHOB|nr:HK97 family phage prohead protease [Parasedimentitalea psychrophila]WIY26954.1 HK97 family phage prohead protease [Parasedimentitalea psychrophila]